MSSGIRRAVQSRIGYEERKGPSGELQDADQEVLTAKWGRC